MITGWVIDGEKRVRTCDIGGVPPWGSADLWPMVCWEGRWHDGAIVEVGAEGPWTGWWIRAEVCLVSPSSGFSFGYDVELGKASWCIDLV